MRSHYSLAHFCTTPPGCLINNVRLLAQKFVIGFGTIFVIIIGASGESKLTKAHAVPALFGWSGPHIHDEGRASPCKIAKSPETSYR